MVTCVICFHVSTNYLCVCLEPQLTTTIVLGIRDLRLTVLYANQVQNVTLGMDDRLTVIFLQATDENDFTVAR